MIVIVIVESEENFLREGAPRYIPVGAVHLTENPGSEPMLLFEEQTGTYFGADNVIRYEDIFSRI